MPGGPGHGLAACGPPNAVSKDCIVQYMCSSLVYVLHFLVLILTFTFCFDDQCIQSILEGQLYCCKVYLALCAPI